MTTIATPLASRVYGLCVQIDFRIPVLDDGSLTWTPDLSAQEQTTVNRLLKVASSAVTITPSEWQAIESDIDGLQTFQNLASPTLAQTVLAVKAQSRILRALLRN